MEVYKERGQIRGHGLEIEFIQNKLSLGARSFEGEKAFSDFSIEDSFELFQKYFENMKGSFETSLKYAKNQRLTLPQRNSIKYS